MTGVTSQGTPMIFEEMHATVFGSPAATPAETKVLVIAHGDSGKGDYMLDFAERWGGDGVISMVMARPGCYIEGRKSDGSHKNKKGDLYTRKSMDKYAAGLKEVKKKYGTEHIYLIGHSGGAATSALILDLYPSIAEGAVLISLPADVPKWRMHSRGRNNWKSSLSPTEHVSNIAPDTFIAVAVGSNDTNTPPWLSELYVDALKKAHKPVTYVKIAGGEHRFKDSKTFQDAVDPQIKEMLAGTK
ncbi:S9 family peptidase [Desulfovibrio sp. JC010]|uniref:alpha/beta hydrolase family protein n=1 Tax=Desulfovibrio sp. JC010 TaxID=2593641 RepID=UPI0013D70270|nr:prolyl oligopeptidase family serine peptidase [Desulfovibrio sp. JC010]